MIDDPYYEGEYCDQCGDYAVGYNMDVGMDLCARCRMIYLDVEFLPTEKSHDSEYPCSADSRLRHL